MDETKKPKSKRVPNMDLLDRAMGEFQDYGRVVSVKCDECDGLIEIVALGDSAWSMRCPCGKFNDTLRGI
ncbi:MAG TPA: hypothetical protein VF547_04050 [Allosphingosinicella sp.]|jgi:hypothetical protein